MALRCGRLFVRTWSTALTSSKPNGRQVAAVMPKSADGIMQQLSKSLDDNGEELVQKMKGLVLFKIDGDEWALDLRSGKGKLTKGSPEGDTKPDLTLTISDENFAKLVMGKLGPQQAFLLRKLKIGGSMGMALKLQPILDAAAPKSKM